MVWFGLYWIGLVFFFPNSWRLGSSAIVKVSGQDGAPFRKIPPVPNRVPNNFKQGLEQSSHHISQSRVWNRVPNQVSQHSSQQGL